MSVREFTGYGGLRLAAEVYGEPENPGVLLLPGGGQTRAAWAPAARALAAAGRHVVALDLRGHGDSARAPGAAFYSLDAFVGDLLAVLSQIENRPVIVGASFGGWVAMAALGEAGAHLAAGLVLVDAPPRLSADGVEQMGAALRRQGARGGAAWDPAFLEGIPMEEAALRLSAAAGKLAVPTLIIRGGASPLSTAESVAELGRMIPGAEVAEIEGAGHLVAMDRADAFHAVLLDFLERRAPRAAPEYREGSDARTLRDALGCFSTGVTIVTTLDTAGKPVGLTANSFTSVSLDPPLLLVCIARSAGSLPCFEAGAHFGVNVLQIGQQPASSRFAARGETDRFAGTPWEAWDTGVPLLQHALASFECARHAVTDGGDHVILVGRVLRVRFEPWRDPLLYFRGKYRRLHFH